MSFAYHKEKDVAADLPVFSGKVSFSSLTGCMRDSEVPCLRACMQCTLDLESHYEETVES